jgi:indolepyruvate ferredoxin oxidoreductase beta subunit
VSRRPEHADRAVHCDVVLAGVGGQGVLSIAWVLGHAAVEAGLHLKQPEVHGMAQRGGAVSAHVRLASTPIASDLIAEGSAAMVISVEPLESLRYAKLLRPDGWIVTDVTTLENVANYPAEDALYDVLFGAPRVLALNATRLAARAGTVKAQNMVVLGAAASRLPVPGALFEKHVRALFAAKGARIADANVAAFRTGVAACRFHAALVEAGVVPVVASRVTAALDFAPTPVGADAVAAWAAALRGDDGRARALRLFAARATPHDAEDVGVAATC